MPIYDYECACGERLEDFASISERKDAIRCECGCMAKWRISAPALHTIDTFVRGIRDRDVQRSHTSGEYIDPNLSHNKDGSYTPITSLKQRERLMKEKGLYEIQPDDRLREIDRDKERQAKSFSATGIRG